MIARLANEIGIDGIEVAPTMVWPRPLETTEDEARRYRAFWNDRGLPLVAMQALLFGRPDLSIFEGQQKRAETLDYLEGVMRLASWLGVPILVFGSPKNRRVGALRRDEADLLAEEFFRDAGARAARWNVTLCIEPNPPQYDCDFVTTSDEGRSLVERTSRVGFGLHLDSAAMTLSGEDIEAAVARHARIISHFHVSEPYLGPIARGVVRHDLVSAALREASYQGYCSVEMRHLPGVDEEGEMNRVLRFLKSVYGG